MYMSVDGPRAVLLLVNNYRLIAPLGVVPDPISLQDLPLISEDSAKEKQAADSPMKTESATVSFIGAGLPPVPQKLVQRIQAGDFVDMAELLPDRLGINAGSKVIKTIKNKSGAK